MRGNRDKKRDISGDEMVVVVVVVVVAEREGSSCIFVNLVSETNGAAEASSLFRNLGRQN